MFGLNKSASLPEAWRKLESIEDLDKADQISHDRPVMFFKHSTTCGISAGALDSVITNYDLPVQSLQVYYLDLLAHRDLSQAIARRYGVIHQSPQVLLIHAGKVIANTSHHAISLAYIKEELMELER